jgi:quercetin dioxygenase-like cupin family protein
LAFLACVGPATARSAANVLPDPFEAGWRGHKVCEVLADNLQLRTLRCTFPPGEGHERHYHAPHWGYVLAPSTMRITSASGTVTRVLKVGDTWWSDGVEWHEVLNVGTTTGVYLIVEPKTRGSGTQ